MNWRRPAPDRLPPLATRSGLVLAACLIMLGSPFVLKADEPKGIAPGIPDEMANLFDLYCLKAFPNLHAVEALASQRGDEALSAMGLPKPVQVWADRGPSGRSIISAMAAPPGGCSVRRMTPNGLTDTRPFIGVLHAFANANGLTLLFPEPMLLSKAKIFGVVAQDQSGRQIELFIVSTFDDRDYRPAELAEIGEDAPGVEIYLGRGRSTLPRP